MLFSMQRPLGLEEIILPTLELELLSQIQQGIVQAVTWHALNHCIHNENYTFIDADNNINQNQELGLNFDDIPDDEQVHSLDLNLNESITSAEHTDFDSNMDENLNNTPRLYEQWDVPCEEDWESEATNPPFCIDPSTLPKPAEYVENSTMDFESMEVATAYVKTVDDYINEDEEERREREERPTLMPGNPCKVFVDNIDYRATQYEVWEFFKKFGGVRYCQLLKTSNRRSRGKAFVKFISKSVAQAALDAPSEELLLRTREMRVEAAMQKQPRQKDDKLKETASATQTEEEICDVPGNVPGIDRIPDQCLLHIFSFMDLRQTIQLERVCHRWRRISLAAWRSRQTLCFANMFTFFTSLRDMTVESLLRRGSDVLHTLDLSASPRLLTDRTLKAIAKHCPNLVRLNVSGMSISNKGLGDMAHGGNLAKLQEFTGKDCFDIGEKGLWYVFKFCRELQLVDLTNVGRLTGQCFHVLTPNVTCLVLNGCSRLSDTGVEKLSACPNLTELHLDRCTSLTDAGLRHLNNCSKLKIFSLGGCLPNVNCSGLSFLKELPDLEELNLHANPAVEDSTLLLIQSCTKIRSLELSECRALTDAGVSRVGGLCKLQVLGLSYLHLLSDTCLTALSDLCSLHTLVSRGCGGLSSQGFGELLISSPSLRVLDVCGCDLWSPHLLEAARIHCHEGNSLILYAGGGDIDKSLGDGIEDLVVHWEDYSDYTLRHDRDMMHYLDFSDDDKEEDFMDFDVMDEDDDLLINDDPLNYEELT